MIKIRLRFPQSFVLPSSSNTSIIIMSNIDCEILIELTIPELEKYIEYHENSQQLENVYVYMYLKNQLNWNHKIEAMSDDEKSQLNDRCRQKFYRYKYGKPESYTLIGLTGEKV